jgi:hypothetical protein
VLHVVVDSIDVLGLRVPDYSREPARRRACWDWVRSVADTLIDRPAVILGDFNVDPDYPKAQCGDRLRARVDSGWTLALPSTGASFWRLASRAPPSWHHVAGLRLADAEARGLAALPPTDIPAVARVHTTHWPDLDPDTRARVVALAGRTSTTPTPSTSPSRGWGSCSPRSSRRAARCRCTRPRRWRRSTAGWSCTRARVASPSRRRRSRTPAPDVFKRP